jgi:hypothetical protein
MRGIQNWLPSFDVGERHEAMIALPPEQALQLALGAPAAPDSFVRLLLRIRGLRPDGSIEEFMAANGFLLLERTATSYVVGLFVGRSLVPVADPGAWRAANSPRSLKIAADFRAEPVQGGARVITETRVAATGFVPLLVFRLYWLIVGPFSALIRRRWLRAAVAQQNVNGRGDR